MHHVTTFGRSFLENSIVCASCLKYILIISRTSSYNRLLNHIALKLFGRLPIYGQRSVSYFTCQSLNK